MRYIVCIPQMIANHIFGENHKPIHRCCCGGVMCIVGLFMMLVTHHTFYDVYGEFAGASFHAIGFHPIIETIQTKKNNQNNENSNS